VIKIKIPINQQNQQNKIWTSKNKKKLEMSHSLLCIHFGYEDNLGNVMMFFWMTLTVIIYRYEFRNSTQITLHELHLRGFIVQIENSTKLSMA
jgi:hypothetical protein